MKINVTRTDINNGSRGSCQGCPVALALSRAFDTNDVFVGGMVINIRGTKYPAPHSVRQFMTLFDNGKNPPPFSFELC